MIPKYAFFGSSRLSVIVLHEMQSLGYTPECIVTTRDKPQGRSLTITPNEVKVWAQNHGIRVYDPSKFDDKMIEALVHENCAVFIVASYGKIIPENVINIPSHGILNIHPSLIPQYRGASPLQTTILNDTKNTGVTIMLVDKEMDHGPIVAAKSVKIDEWPTYDDFEIMMAKIGSKLLVDILPEWISGKIKAIEQNHSTATFTKKIKKDDALINLNDDPYKNFLKIQAYHHWPKAFFIAERDGTPIRVKITSAKYANGKLIIEKVIPEGRKEMSYDSYCRSVGSGC